MKLQQSTGRHGWASKSWSYHSLAELRPGSLVVRFICDTYDMSKRATVKSKHEVCSNKIFVPKEGSNHTISTNNQQKSLRSDEIYGSILYDIPQQNQQLQWQRRRRVWPSL